VEIKILGGGCSRCDQTAKVVEEVLKRKGLPVELEKITDVLEIATYGVVSIPAVVIDGQVVCSGRVPTAEEVESWVEGK